MQLTGAQTIVQTLKALNVRHVFSLPGTGIMQLLDALVDEPAIQCVTVRHEQIASHMGDGYARAAKEPGVVLVSRGPGAVNTLVGLVTAHPACSPVVVIAGQAPTSWLGREAFEEFDLVAMFRPTTKYAFEVERMNTLPEVIRRAMRASVTGRPGPVLVSVPFDLLTESDDVAINPAHFTYPTRLRPDPRQVEQAATLLVEARNPAIFAGGGVGISDAFEEMQALAEALGCPVVPTSEEDMLPTAHPLLTTDKGLVQQADVVLAVGCRFTEFATSAWTLLKAGQKLIHIDIDPYQIDKVYPADVGIVADAKMALADLLPAVKDRLRGDGSARAKERAAALTQKKAEARAKRWPTEEWDTAPIRPWVMVKAMQEIFPPDAYIVQDTATLGAWMARCFDFPRAGRYVWSVGGSMGFGLPAAAGVKLARPSETVISLMGDCAFMMVDATLDTLASYRIPVLTVVWNNNAYMQTGWRYPRVPGNYVKNPDFARLAELFGVPGRRVEKPEELRDALTWGVKEVARGNPALVDVATLCDVRYAAPSAYYGTKPVYQSGAPPAREHYLTTPIR